MQPNGLMVKQEGGRGKVATITLHRDNITVDIKGMSSYAVVYSEKRGNEIYQKRKRMCIMASIRTGESGENDVEKSERLSMGRLGLEKGGGNYGRVRGN